MTSVLTAALLHFLWQGLLVFILLRAALFLLRGRSANARYAANCTALAILAAAPAITAAILYRPPAALLPSLSATTLAVAAASAARTNSWSAALRPWILPVWAFGVALCSLRMLWACAQVASLRRRSAPAAAAIQQTVAQLAGRLGVTRRARVLISTWTGGPCVVGWLRPAILLPAAALAGLTPDQLEAVLAHELAHIRRHDYLVNWLQIAAETLLFYHPAVWWISSRIREERELCCDDLAVRACAAPVCYARALTALEKIRGSTPAAALAGTGAPLLHRIQRIVGSTASPYGPSRASGIVAVVLALAFLGATVRWTRAQSQPTEDYLRAGDTLLRSGSNDLALEKYREGLDRHPEDRVTYQKRTIETLMRMKRKADAYAVNDDLLHNHPDDTDGLTLRAAALVDRGETTEAIRILQIVLERAPENPVAHLNLGLAYAAQQQLDSARQQMDEALRLRPDFTRAQAELRTLPRATPPQDDGLALTRLLEEAARSPRGDVYLRLGEAYRRVGQFANAIASLEKAKELLPENRDVLAALALALREAGRDAESAAILDHASMVERNQTELTANFLRDELQKAQENLLALRETAAADAQQREARAAVDELRHRLQIAQNAAMLRLQLDLREQKLAAAKIAGDREAARQLDAQVRHLKAARAAEAESLQRLLQELEVKLGQNESVGSSQESEATKLKIRDVRLELERLLGGK